jgi:uncharacterized protein DUF5995
MGRGRRRGVALAAIAVLAATAALAPAGGTANHRALVIERDNLVAPIEIPRHPHPGPVPGCRHASLRCVRATVRRLRALEQRMGCNHRAVFATTYRVLTQVALETVRDNPRFLRYLNYFYFQDALFADIYLATGRAWVAGRRVAPAWRIAFEAARDKDLLASQDMLLGINAHVQNDMPYLLAALGTHTRRRHSRKVDHDAENGILERAYQRVVDTVERKYDPSLAVTNPDNSNADDIAGLELVAGWREQVWRNARRLLMTRRDPAAHAEVVHDIETNAADWARTIAASETPGYRSQRDAYCRERRAG